MSAYWIDKEEERREDLLASFRSEYGISPTHLISAPGRAELLGAYSHFDRGGTLTCALSCDVLCAVAKRQDGMAEFRSGETLPVRFSVHDLESREREKGKTVALFRGVLGFLKKRGYPVGGFSAYSQSNVFSAAGAGAAAGALTACIEDTLCFGGKLSSEEKARAGEYAQNVYFGSAGGIAEQAASVVGGILRLSFEGGELSAKRLPVPKDHSVVLVCAEETDRAPFFEKTGKQLKEVAAFYGKKHLQDVPFGLILEDLNLLRRKVSDGAIVRAFDYFEENERTRRAADALSEGDLGRFFACLNESGQSALALRTQSLKDDPVFVCMKQSGHLIKNGGFNLLRGTGTVVAFLQSDEAQSYFRAMARLFGRERVFLSEIRRSGAVSLKL